MKTPSNGCSSPIDVEKVKRIALRYAVQNALKHGKAKPGPVINKVLGELVEYRPYARGIIKIVNEVVEEVNRMTPDELRALAERLGILEERVEVKEEKKLPPLPSVDVWGYVKTRFAPNPDFLIHLGNARAAIISYEYARMYNGKFILRFEDTDPRIKKPLPEAYEMIRYDLRWLGITWDEEYIQSLRMEIYYDYAKKLIELGGAYVDLCPPQAFREYRDKGIPCPHRERAVEDQLELFDKMLEGHFSEGEAVLRIKTDLKHPDPGVRDWVAFRIIDTSKHPHPIVGDRYIVWPTYNFAVAIDDHLMGITHIMRGREHAVNTVKQMFIYKYFGWRYPEVIHFGRVNLEGFILSKSKIKSLLKTGKFMGLDDIRFGTIASLRRRGILPETIKQIILELGVKQTDAIISWENVASANRKIGDQKCKRVFVVLDPVKVALENLDIPKDVELRFHPSADLGTRKYTLTRPEIYVDRRDVEVLKHRGMIRLMEFANIEFVSWDDDVVVAKIHSVEYEEARRRNLQIIQWIPVEHSIGVVIYKAEGLKLRKVKGVGESYIRKLIGETVQMVRIGFGRIDEVSKSYAKIMYAHD